jgi:hypothetical protein
MKRTSPAADLAARALNLAGSLESRVGGAQTFLSIIEQNTPQIIAQIEKI